MLKAGIIGLGKMGMSHAAIVGANPDVNFVAVCDTSSLVLDVFKKYTKLNTYSDYIKMFDKEQLDFVLVATPTKFHYPIVKYALEKNVNVFCEKPFSLKSSQGNELNEIATRRSLINQVGYHNHFIGTFRELKRLLCENVIGNIVHFTGEAYGPVVTKEKGNTWRSNPDEGGGCTSDYAAHVINLIQEIIGRPVQINGTLLKSIYSKEKLGMGWTTKYITEFAIPVNFYLRGEEYSAQIEYFVNNVKNKKQGAYNTFEQALYTDRVIEMIMDNAKQN